MTLQHIYSGKVRDIFAVGDDHLLMVTSDRISAFDVVMAEPVPHKGRVLTAFTDFWLGKLADIAPSHLVAVDPADMPAEVTEAAAAAPAGSALADLAGRAMLVRKADMLPIECIVRGYLSGSAWKEYRRSGTVHGMKMPEGMQESDQLPEPVFTPSTKATEGHDENIGFDDAVRLVGDALATEARDLSLAAYRRAAEWAAERGIIIADTKFEFGMIDGRLAICDEVLTPDSSRFWPADQWKPGATPPSFDKQPLRDWLEASGWDKTPPPPTLPEAIVSETSGRYRSAYEMVTGRSFADWFGAGA